MWETKEDPSSENFLIVVGVSTIITILFFWFSWFVNLGFDWVGLGILSIMSVIFGPIIFKIYIILFGVVIWVVEWFKEKSQ